MCLAAPGFLRWIWACAFVILAAVPRQRRHRRCGLLFFPGRSFSGVFPSSVSRVPGRICSGRGRWLLLLAGVAASVVFRCSAAPAQVSWLLGGGAGRLSSTWSMGCGSSGSSGVPGIPPADEPQGQSLRRARRSAQSVHKALVQEDASGFGLRGISSSPVGVLAATAVGDGCWCVRHRGSQGPVCIFLFL